ncbi:MAG: hypothetical protein HC911_17225 [Chloroflexaceae bacterium]|nr:hypothetical protein [Chloroflexaceae bacterium]
MNDNDLALRRRKYSARTIYSLTDPEVQLAAQILIRNGVSLAAVLRRAYIEAVEEVQRGQAVEEVQRGQAA